MDSTTLDAIDVDKMIEGAVPPPLCEWQEGGAPKPCDEPATWICVMACGHSFYYCDPHAEERKRYIAMPGANFCRGRLDRGKLHRGPALADPVRFSRIAP